jgi:two-component system response regulator HupR/HoxA
VPEPVDYKAYPILIVDDERAIVATFTLNFEDDFTVFGATNGREAFEIVTREPIAVLVADQRMPDMHGVEVIRQSLEVRPDLVPIVLTGYTDMDALVRAVNLGRIFRYIAKPWDRDELELTIRRAIETVDLVRRNTTLMGENARLVTELQRANERLVQENRYLKSRDAGTLGEILGRSPAIEAVRDRARRVAASATTTVLIEGPTGTGKELLARSIHYEGPRAEKLFVAMNCGASTESLLESELFGYRKGAFTGAMADKKGLFEIADGGTIFLDEIGEASSAFQVQLLRVLQDGEIRPVGATRPVKVDVRVVAATNRDLKDEVEAGRFRADLYYRLAVMTLRVPPLTERREDIALLVDHFLARHCHGLGLATPKLTAGALAALRTHEFHGNVRELSNLVERALLLADPGEPITEAHLFDRHPAAPPPGENGEGAFYDQVRAFERELIVQALARNDGSKTTAAKDLGVSYRWLLKLLKRHGFD